MKLAMEAKVEEIHEALQQSFGLDLPEQVSKEKIILALSIRVQKMMAGNPDQLFSLLYRLDISERRIKGAMQQSTDLPIKIAALIYERQEEKIQSRLRYKMEQPPEDLSW